MNPGNLLWWSQFLFIAWAGAAPASEMLYAGDEVLEIELRGPLARTIDDTKARDANRFSLIVGGIEVPVSLRVRGKSRAQVCSFPPLRLDIEPGAAIGTPFAGQERLKLVTHCRASPGHEQNVIDEYAAYQMFAMLSEVSYRTRLLRIRYVDTDKPGRPALVRHGFVIEPARRLAARTGGDVLKVPHVVKARLDPDQAALVFVFQYLIASADWSLVAAAGDRHCCHNIDLIAIEGAHHLVPFDFDLSGLVAPKYARRGANKGVQEVRNRRYRGYCIDSSHLAAALQGLLDQQAAFQALLQALPAVDAKATGRQQEFLERFYRDVGDPEVLAAKLDRRCVDR